MLDLLLILAIYLVVAPAGTLFLASIVHTIRIAVLRQSDSPRSGSGAPAPAKATPATATTGDRHRFHLMWFRPVSLIAGMFSRHTQAEIELALSRGYLETTPALSADMAHLPSPWLAPRLFWSLVAALLATLAVLLVQHDLLIMPAIYFLGAAAIPLALLMAFYEYNSPDNVSLALLARFAALGGAIAVLFSTLFYALGTGIGIRHTSPIAGLVEESAKLLAVLLLSRKLDRQRYPYALNGLLFGAAMGAGFSIIETSGYILQFSWTIAQVQGHCALIPGLTVPCTRGIVKFSIPTALAIMGYRGLLAPFGHIIWTGYAAGYYWWQRHERPRRAPVVAFCLALVVPIILHTLWDNFDGTLTSYMVNGTLGWIAVLEMLRLGYLQIWLMTRGHAANLPASPQAP